MPSVVPVRSLPNERTTHMEWKTFQSSFNWTDLFCSFTSRHYFSNCWLFRNTANNWRGKSLFCYIEKKKKKTRELFTQVNLPKSHVQIYLQKMSPFRQFLMELCPLRAKGIDQRRELIMRSVCPVETSALPSAVCELALSREFPSVADAASTTLSSRLLTRRWCGSGSCTPLPSRWAPLRLSGPSK